MDLSKLASARREGKIPEFTGRTGSRGELSARFALRRVTPCGEQNNDLMRQSRSFGRNPGTRVPTRTVKLDSERAYHDDPHQFGFG